MAVVGDASIIVRAITTKVKGDIEKAFRDARPAIQAEGREAAKSYAGAFDQGLQQRLRPALASALHGAESDLDAAGQRGGQTYGSSVTSSAEREMSIGLSRAARDAGTSAERELGGSGRRGGNAFGKGFLDSNFSKSAQQASKTFTQLFAISNLVGPAIGGLVGSLSAAVSGLFAMGAAAGQAAGALAVLPGALSVLMQSFAALKLAFSGVGEALKSGLKAADAQTGTTGANTIAAARAIADAQKALARAYQDAADAARDAAQRVADAEQDVADAQRNVLAVQRELNDARARAAEDLQQLAFSAEDAALAEERAGLRLEEARNKLVAVSSLPPDDRARQEAELSFKEAELSFREAKDRNADLAKEQENAAKAGVEGSREVLDAKQAINDAQAEAADAEKKLAAARLAQSRQQRDSAQAIADAQERLRRAIEDSRKSTSAAATANSAYLASLDKLSPAAQEFVKHLVAMKDEARGLKQDIGAQLFGPLTKSIDLLVQGTFPILRSELQDTGGILGKMALQFAQAFTTPANLKGFQSILRGNNEILKVFTDRTGGSQSAIQALADLFLKFAQAIQPVTLRFATWIAGLIKAKNAATQVGTATSGLTGFFNRAGDTAAQLGRIFGNLWESLKILSGASSEAGHTLLDAFEGATEKLTVFLQKMSDDGSLTKFFNGAATNLISIGRLVADIGGALLSFGDNPGIGQFAEGLRPAIPIFKQVGDSLIAASPALGDLATEFAKLIGSFTQTGQMTAFIKALTVIIRIINNVIGVVSRGLTAALDGAFGKGTAKNLAGIVLGGFAIIKAFSFALRPVTFLFKALVGGPLRFLSAFSKLKRGLSGFKSGGLKGAFSAMKKGSDDAKLAFERQMVTDKLKIETLERLEKQALQTSGALDSLKVSGAPPAGAAGAVAAAPGTGAVTSTAKAAAAGAGDDLALMATSSLGPAEKAVGKSTGRMGKMFGGFKQTMGGAGKAIGGLGKGLVGFAGGPLGLVLIALPFLIKAFQVLMDKSPAFRAFVGGLIKAFKSVVAAVLPVIAAIGGFLLQAIDFLFKKINEAMPTIKAIMADVFTAISGLITNVLIPVWNNALLPAIKIFINIVQFAIPIVKKIFELLFTAIKFYITKIFIPIWATIFKVIRALWPVVKTIFGVVLGVIKGVFKAIGFVWDNVLRPVFTAIKIVVGTVGDVIARVFNGAKAVFENFKNAFQKVGDFIGGLVTSIVSAFGSIGSAIGDAFKGLGRFAAEGINVFIRFLNDKLIGNINKLTSKFGLEIPSIPEIAGFQKGGWTGPGAASAIAGVVHADEFVMSKESRKRIEATHPGALDYMLRTGQMPPMGGIHIPKPSAILSFAGDQIGNIKDAGKAIAEKGIGKVLETLINGAKSLMGAAGIKRGPFLNDLFYGIIDELAKAAAKFGGDAGKTEGGLAALQAASGVTTNTISTKGWTYPLSKIYPITQYPNQGHSPPWAVDIGAPTGTQVVAAAKGIVSLERDLGNRSYGRYIEIQHENGIRTLYAHLSRFIARVGSVVQTGEVIGLSGSTGGSTGPHLHFEIKPGSDTLAELRKRGVKFAKGGVASATTGGILSVIAEAGKNERVEPLDREGFSKRDRKILELIEQLVASGGSKVDQFVINPSRGMNEAELAKKVAREITFQRRRGV